MRSCKGKVREDNEDNFFAGGITLPCDLQGRDFSLDIVLPAPTVLAVCDGVGGEAMGKEASATAVKRLAEIQDYLISSRSDNLGAAVRAYILNADSGISLLGKRSGTTLALALIEKGNIKCFNVGDSRIYCYKSGKLFRITNDHTAAVLAAEKNGISSERARKAARGNKLTRCIGIGNNNRAEEYPPIKGKCKLLICSDGLTDMISDAEIEKIIACSNSISAAADRLIAEALRSGGKDNITLIASEFSDNELINKLKRKMEKKYEADAPFISRDYKS